VVRGEPKGKAEMEGRGLKSIVKGPKPQVPQGSRFDGRAAIAADAGSGRVDRRHKHFLAAVVLAGASIT